MSDPDTITSGEKVSALPFVDDAKNLEVYGIKGRKDFRAIGGHPGGLATLDPETGSVPSVQLPPEVVIAPARIDASNLRIKTLEETQGSNQIAFQSWASLSSVAGTSVGQMGQVIGDAGTHVDPVSGQAVANSGQYRWTGTAWQWLRADALLGKADKSVVDPLVAWRPFADATIAPLLSHEYIGLQSVPTVGTGSGATGYTFVLPAPAAHDGNVDRVEVYGGATAGSMKIAIYSLSGGVLSKILESAPFAVQAGKLNSIPASLPIKAGQYVGFYSSAADFSFSNSTSDAERPYRASGDAAAIDTGTATRPGVVPRMRISNGYSGYSSVDFERAVQAGNLTVGAFDGYSVAARRPMILDIDGTLGPVDSLYVPRDMWFSRSAVAGVTASNAVVTNVAGGYARIPLSPGDGWWDTGFINTVYYDPDDNTFKNLTGTAVPSGKLLTKVLPLFQITGRNGGWRSASGLNVEVRRAPRGQQILADYYDAVTNNMRDVRVAWVGDSKSWGMGATGAGPTTPRNHSLSDVRNNFTSKSLVNLVRRWMAKLSVGEQNETSPAPGETVHSTVVQDSPRYDSNFQAIRADGVVPRDGGGTNSAATLKRYLDSPASPAVTAGRIVFRYTGENISIVHAALDGGEYEFWVDGVLKTTFVYAPPVRFGVVTDLTGIAFGKHTVEIIAKGTQLFRMEAVRRTKVVALANNGLIGTNTSEWLPGGSLLSGAVAPDRNFVFIQLGTNDRDMAAGTGYPAGSAGTYQNLIDIVTWLRDNRPGIGVILVAPSYVPVDGPQGSSNQVAAAVRRAAGVLGTGYIDNFSPTHEAMLAGETVLADGIHENNLGYRYEFQNFLRSIVNSLR